MVVIGDAPPPQLASVLQGNASHLMLPPGLQQLADAASRGPFFPSAALEKPKLAPRPALPRGPVPAPRAVRAPHSTLPAIVPPMPLDLAALWGTAPAGLLQTTPPPPPGLGSLQPGLLTGGPVVVPPLRPVLSAPVLEPLSLASFLPAPAVPTPTRKSGDILRELKGLPQVDPSSADDITKAWMEMASMMPSGDADAVRQPGDAASSRNSNSVQGDMMKALKAAAATNTGSAESVSSESQLKSWLALANQGSSDAVQQIPDSRLEAVDAPPVAAAEEAPLAEAIAPQELNPPVVQQAPLMEVIPEKMSEEAKASAAKATETAAAVALAAKAAAAASAAVVTAPSGVMQSQMQAVQESSPSLEMLKAMADTQSSSKVKEDEQVSSESQPARAVAGYAAVSMMHRAAESAKAKMRQQMAENLLTDAKIPHGDRAHASQEHDAINSADCDASESGHIFFGSMPKGIGEGLIQAECSKYGAVSSIFYDSNAVDIIEGGWALVTYANRESAVAAVSKLGRRSGLFGAAQPLIVRLGTAEDLARAQDLRKHPPMPEKKRQILQPEDVAPASAQALLAEAARKVQHDASHSAGNHEDRKSKNTPRTRGTGPRSRSRSRDRKRRREAEDHDDRSRRRRRDRSSEPEAKESKKEKERKKERRKDSEASGNSDKEAGGDSAAPNSAVAPVPVERKSRGLGGLGGFGASPVADFDKSSSSGIGHPDEPGGGRQVGVKGNWAEFATPDNRAYFVHILTGAKQWNKPIGFDSDAKTGAAITRGKNVAANKTGHSNIFVGCLPPGVNDAMVRQLFEPYGRIVTMKVVPQARYGFIKYSNMAEALAAIERMNGQSLGGILLQVKMANMDRNF